MGVKWGDVDLSSLLPKGYKESGGGGGVLVPKMAHWPKLTDKNWKFEIQPGGHGLIVRWRRVFLCKSEVTCKQGWVRANGCGSAGFAAEADEEAGAAYAGWPRVVVGVLATSI